MSVLSIRGLGKRFGSTDALVDFDLDVAKASRTAIVGPSGSGKTTLLRLIAGFEMPDQGEIRLDGEPIATPETGLPAHRRNIGLVMQEGALFPHLTVLDNIRFGIRGEKDTEARAQTLMDLVELDRAMANRQPHQLSGGQQQRVALARALARQPRLMLLDEPFSALDTGLREQLRHATADILTKAGIATVLVTHDRDEAMSFADQLLILRSGRLIQAGPPRQLYLAPRDEGVAAFLGQAIILDAEITGKTARCRLGEVPVANPAPQGPCRILLRPEQLHIAATPGSSPWRLQAVEPVGPIARVTLGSLDGTPDLTFDTPAIGLPPLDTPIVLHITGSAYRLG
jgi:iron(III) transport system ATP-binding protein